jgi:hypothetical protein
MIHSVVEADAGVHREAGQGGARGALAVVGLDACEDGLDRNVAVGLGEGAAEPKEG